MNSARASRDPSDLIPLTPLVFHVLLSLAEERRHGYAIIQQVRERTEGRVRIGSGSLYAVIRRLRRAGMIEECEDRLAPGDDERRRYYLATRFGRRVLEAEVNRMRQATRLADQFLLGDPAPEEGGK